MCFEQSQLFIFLQFAFLASLSTEIMRNCHRLKTLNFLKMGMKTKSQKLFTLLYLSLFLSLLLFPLSLSLYLSLSLSLSLYVSISLCPFLPLSLTLSTQAIPLFHPDKFQPLLSTWQINNGYHFIFWFFYQLKIGEEIVFFCQRALTFFPNKWKMKTYFSWFNSVPLHPIMHTHGSNKTGLKQVSWLGYWTVPPWTKFS